VQQPPFNGTSYVFLDRQEAKDMRRLGLTVVEIPLRGSFLGCCAHEGAGGRPTCVAFTGTVGRACGCAIYGDRPRVCRQFTVGERLCRQARQQAGLPV
jgi:Fe-S-cluster containining protein